MKDFPCNHEFDVLILIFMCILLWIQVAENLAQLMYSVMMTGYMFKNAQYRLELQLSLDQIALPDPEEKNVCLLKHYDLDEVCKVLTPLVPGLLDICLEI